VSRLDPSGADQIDAEHQATDLAVGGSNPSRRADVQVKSLRAEFGSNRRGRCWVVIAKGDVRLRHLARDLRCVLAVFEVG
jgi:hypothetical protein